MLINEPIEFQWDKGNKDKNLKKHEISNTEAEEVFFDEQKKIGKDALHSKKERRFILFGKTKTEKILCIIFTLRNGTIRIISARPAHKKERRLYSQ